ncbi:hypothetical protein GOB85_07625 [Acetobacter sp. LMG 1636]|nr:hypothetical protein [Acetobacter fallax]
MPYFQAYDYYAKRCNDFKDDILLKCDDDIVYLDTNGFEGFVDAIRNNPQYFLLSANVINNGICAYLQQKNGGIPETIGTFESPSGGLCGSLWESGEKAFALHQYFVKSGAKAIPLEAPVVEWSERNSINFIGWRGENLKHMNFPQGDDERFMTVTVPRYLKRKTAVYSDFMVAHLSFYAQEMTVKPDDVISLYRTLTRD